VRRLLHISDVHFGPPHRPEVARGVIAFARARRPDLVVISGDLSLRAKARQFADARRFVDRIEQAAGVATLSVPGNHDVPLYRVWERVFDPYGAYRRHFSSELEPTFEDDQMLVVGINTAHGWTEKDGRVSERRLAEVAARFARCDAGKIRIVVQHHELAPAPRFDNLRVMRGAGEAIEVFTRSGVELVLAGHLHQAFLASSEAYYPSHRPPLLVLHAGTTTSSRGRGSEVGLCSANWIAIDAQTVVWTHLGWHQRDARFVPWSEHRYPRRERRLDGLAETAMPGAGGAQRW